MKAFEKPNNEGKAFKSFKLGGKYINGKLGPLS